MTPLLVTIAFSHFCEKARWALDRAGIAYEESAHLPVFHAFGVKRAGGRRSTPALVTDEGVLDDSTDIVAFCDRRRPAAGLYGKSAEEKREILALEDLFDEQLGPHVRRWAYFHLLADRPAILRMFAAQPGVPALEQRLMPPLFPLARAVMRASMKIDAEGAERSRRKVDEVFATVAERLADGRRYLVGDAFTAADLTFAALAAPGVLPDGLALRYPNLTDLPAPVATQVKAWRAHPAGAFATRLAGEERQATTHRG
jgi:glutathione S-transferase